MISSWSKRVLVVEASEKSGALITADFAKSMGKEVYVPPHEINSSSGKGSNKLLLEGAKLYLEPSQLIYEKDTSIDKKQIMLTANNLKRLKMKEAKTGNNNLQNLSPVEEKILSCISNESKSIESISMETQIDQVKLIEYLSEMELEGKIKVMSGARFSPVV